MPQAPMLPPEEMAKAAAGGATGINPANFLIAAADMHNSGQLSMPKGPSQTMPSLSKHGGGPKKLKVLK
jgi:hypothetical protein